MSFVDALVPVFVLSAAYFLLFAPRRPQESEAQNKKVKERR
jgi:hypothetical protein